MKFEIDWNRHSDDKTLEELGAKLIDESDFSYYEIELNSLEEMENLHKLVFEKTKKYYSLVIDFDRPTIYLDKDV